MILFLSKYPETQKEFRDGFYQRVENIDQFYLDEERIYLHTSIFKNRKKKVIIDGLKTQISCNIFLHFFVIMSLFNKSSIIYIQSIYNALNTILFILLYNKFYVLDLHGVVPEELIMQKKKKLAFIFSNIEKILFKKINIGIAVTNKMAEHYKIKYPNSNAKYIIYAILPSHLMPYEVETSENDTVEVIYSGNTQVWQNIDLMLSSIKKNINNQFNFTILTGEPEKFIEKLNKYGIDINKITLKSVKPEELEGFYKKSHYGFVLRDDILVNRVACPTKIIEYLNYGITPIILSEKIGDFEDFGYEYISLNDLNGYLLVGKSLKNIEVVNEIFSKNRFNLKLEIKKYGNF